MRSSSDSCRRIRWHVVACALQPVSFLSLHCPSPHFMWRLATAAGDSLTCPASLPFPQAGLGSGRLAAPARPVLVRHSCLLWLWLWGVRPVRRRWLPVLRASLLPPTSSVAVACSQPQPAAPHPSQQHLPALVPCRWDLHSEALTPEEFAAELCADSGVDARHGAAVAAAIRIEVRGQGECEGCRG